MICYHCHATGMLHSNKELQGYLIHNALERLKPSTHFLSLSSFPFGTEPKKTLMSLQEDMVIASGKAARKLE